jgi:hypothetical protein
MSLVKRLCRQAGKPFLSLRSASLAPFCAAFAKSDTPHHTGLIVRCGSGQFSVVSTARNRASPSIIRA